LPPIGQRAIVELQRYKDGTLPERVLKDVFNRYDLFDSLQSLANKSLEIYKFNLNNISLGTLFRDPRSNILVTQFSLAYLANIFLISGSNPYKSVKLNYADNVAILSNIYSNKLIDPILSSVEQLNNFETFVPFMIRANFEQMRLQDNPLYPFTRSIYIFTNILPNTPHLNSIDIIDLFHSKVGVTVPDFFKLSALILASAQKNPIFSKAFFLNTRIPKIQNLLNEDHINKILSFYTIHYKSFFQLDKKFNSEFDPVYTKFRFNPLFIYPIIEFDSLSTPFIIPNTYALQHRITNGLYWWLEDYFRQINLQNDFRTYFGNIFQEYCGTILKSIYGEQNVKPEFTYGKDKRRFIDWHIIKGEKVYLFEVKANQFNLHNNQIASKDSILREEIKKITDAIKQINKRISDISNFDKLRIFKGKKIIPVIVFLNIPFISSTLYKDWIDSQIQSDKTNKLQYFPYENLFMLNINELELYADISDKIEIEDIFNKLKNDVNQNFLSIISSTKNSDILRNPFLDKVYKEFWESNFKT
jgi:hypothetical protein